ncbi:MAG: hypothetical protein GY906_36750 [bacterium]|nr:hypothetical protein [bacterium]
MDNETKAVFHVLAEGLWRVEMTLQLHLNSLQAMGPGPIDKHHLSRLLKDLEGQMGELRSAVKSIDAAASPKPEDETRVRTDLT